MEEEYPNPYEAFTSKLAPVSDFLNPKTPADGPISNNYSAMNEEMRVPETPKLYKDNPEPGFNYNSANEQIKEQANPASTTYTVQKPADSTEVVSNFFSPPPAPKYDAKRQERVKKLMKINAIGEGMKALGDIFALSSGANVNARRPSDDNRNLYAAWQGYEDNYANRMDEHNRQVWNQKLQALYRGQDLAHRTEREKTEDERYNTNLEYQKTKDAENTAYRNKSLDWNIKDKEVDNARQEKVANAQIKNYDNDNAYKWSNLERQKKMDETRAEKLKASATDKGLILYDDNNRATHELNASQSSRLLNIILSDPATSELAKTDMKLMQAQFGGGLSKLQMTNLVAGYWDKSPEAMKFLGESITTPETTPWTTSQRPAYNGPLKSGASATQSQPAKKTIDFSKLNY